MVQDHKDVTSMLAQRLLLWPGPSGQEGCVSVQGKCRVGGGMWRLCMSPDPAGPLLQCPGAGGQLCQPSCFQHRKVGPDVPNSCSIPPSAPLARLHIQDLPRSFGFLHPCVAPRAPQAVRAVAADDPSPPESPEVPTGIQELESA